MTALRWLARLFSSPRRPQSPAVGAVDAEALEPRLMLAATSVTIVAKDALAAEAVNDNGRFVITRKGDRSKALRVKIGVSGTAKRTTDYQALSSTVKIPAGKGSVSLYVRPVTDVKVEPTETVIVRLLSGTGYRVRTPGKATVKIIDAQAAQPPATVTVERLADAAEPGTTGVFVIRRSDPVTQDLRVYFGLSGTAQRGVDYEAISRYATIPGGASQVLVSVPALNDKIAEGDETVILTLTDGAGYVIGAESSAQIALRDNDVALGNELAQLRPGTTWNYRTVAANPLTGVPDPMSVVVTDGGQMHGVSVMSMQITKGTATETYYYSKDDQGLWIHGQISAKGGRTLTTYTYDAPQLVLPAVMDLGVKFTTTYTRSITNSEGTLTETVSREVIVNGYKNMTVPAGTFRCLDVLTAETVSVSDGTSYESGEQLFLNESVGLVQRAWAWVGGGMGSLDMGAMILLNYTLAS